MRPSSAGTTFSIGEKRIQDIPNHISLMKRSRPEGSSHNVTKPKRPVSPSSPSSIPHRIDVHDADRAFYPIVSQQIRPISCALCDTRSQSDGPPLRFQHGRQTPAAAQQHTPTSDETRYVLFITSHIATASRPCTSAGIIGEYDAASDHTTITSPRSGRR